MAGETGRRRLGFDADGCGSAHAAASAAVTLVRGKHTVLEAARIGHYAEVAQELGVV